ncbi:hypothetical protein ACHAWO_007977 [Cyclotella atomus]|uniref:PiggyBac transposable element-derived protein domain-containing protein n=1 Tax=Cyclotella atomus TaxID=382360 RepID=A0ABD3PED2_9STRA
MTTSQLQRTLAPLPRMLYQAHGALPPFVLDVPIPTSPTASEPSKKKVGTRSPRWMSSASSVSTCRRSISSILSSRHQPTHQGPKLTISEFYKWLGCQFYMACYEGISDRTLWWSSKKVDMFDTLPPGDITGALRLTDRPYPTDFLDRFHEVRQCIEAFNDHYSEKYDPSWLSCLDESMNVWLDKYCPGFMVVPRKPHPEGNEYHTICDGDQGRPILWRMELVEGKDRPKKGAAWAFPCELGGGISLPALMLRMTKPIHGQSQGRVDGFWVLTGQSMCRANRIIDPLKDKELGTTETTSKTLDVRLQDDELHMVCADKVADP